MLAKSASTILFHTLEGFALSNIIPFAIRWAIGDASTPPAPAELAMMMTILSLVRSSRAIRHCSVCGCISWLWYFCWQPTKPIHNWFILCPTVLYLSCHHRCESGSISCVIGRPGKLIITVFASGSDKSRKSIIYNIFSRYCSAFFWLIKRGLVATVIISAFSIQYFVISSVFASSNPWEK